ncbi:MAG: hypothetical protein ACRERD_19875, partial [Candidatus Binatia bacterium]
MSSRLPPFWRKVCAATLVLAAVGLALTCGVTSTRWIGTPFPGFFLLANRVVASVSLPYWPVAEHGHIYQHAVTAVNGQPVHTSVEVYAFVRSLPPNQPVTYTLEKDGHVSQITLPSQTFTLKDYVLLFGAALFTGLAVAFIGIGVWFLKPATPASQALLMLSVTGGLFALTVADLYSPYRFFRLHILGEAFMPAGFLHVALVFPLDRLRRHRLLLLSVPYLIALSLGVAYEVFLYEPTAYSLIHNLCEVYAGIAGLAFLGKVIWDYGATGSYLIRQRIR